ncbi:hypothetical protein C8R44DRAFT_608573, partial [Mycena epipterygia]
MASQVPRIPPTRQVKITSALKALKLAPATRDAMMEHIDAVGLDVRRFTASITEQDSAVQLLIQMGAHVPEELDRDARSKLVIRTSYHSPIARKFTRWQRVYQCTCSSDNEQGHQPSKRRDMPWQNVGCEFWIHQENKITPSLHSDLKSGILIVDEIVSNFTHSTECLSLKEMENPPPIPLHPELREYALSLLCIRVPLSQLKTLCHEWAQNKWGSAVGDECFRFVLNNHETTSLYRTLARERGIAQAPPQNNLDLWFRTENPCPPDPRLTASCLSYTPCVAGEADSRFTLILSTPEQRLAAWRYGHKKQVLMDLTFGVCSGCVLLAILMAIDENNHGIPIAEILFSAQKRAKAVHADYDSALIEEVLGKWKAGMGTNAAGEAFEICVSSTDNDLRTKHLAVIPKGEDREEIRRWLGKFLMRLLKEIIVYEEAITAYNSELAYFKDLAKKRDNISKLKSKGGMAFLTYLQSYLRLRSFWESWSLAGAHEAAKRMGIPVSKVARTTNHLESFNGRLKGKYFAHHMRSGRLPRVDHWVLILITEALPTFFAEWTEKRRHDIYYDQMR